MNSFLFNSILFLDATVDPSSITSSVSDIANSSSTIAGSINDNGIYPTIIGILFVVIIALLGFIIFEHARAKRRSDDELQQSRITDRNMLNDVVKEILESYLKQLPSIVNNNNNKQQSSDSNDDDDNPKQLNTSEKPNTSNIQNMQPSESNVQQNPPTNDYHNDIVGAYIRVSLDLKDICRTVDLKLGCSRVAIYVFHNGNSSIYGLPFFKMSCISEYLGRSDIHAMRGKTHIDMPLHIFNDMVETLYNNNVYMSQNIEETAKNDDCIEEFVKYSSVKALVAKGIDSKDGNLAGFVVAEFANVDTFEGDNDRYQTIMDVLDEASLSAKVLIGNKYVYDKTSNK